MEMFKKKSLNFMGYSRELRKIDRNNLRNDSRLKRYSTIRSFDDDTITEEKKENQSRIPTIGKAPAGSRIEMLQKWKQEKMVKKQQESRLKKPAFKVGVTKPSPSPSVGKKPLFALDTSSKLSKSSFKVSNSQLFGKKQESLAASNIKNTMKDTKIQSCKSKIGIASKLESKWIKNKESSIQPFSRKLQVDTLQVVNKDQLSGSRKQPPITSKALETQKESRLKPLDTRSKVISMSVKSNIPKSGLPKRATSRILKVSDQQTPGKTVKTIDKCLKSVPAQKEGTILEKTNNSESKLLNKPNDDFITFGCELSHIEPVEERKSFAPKGFMFQPPVELSSSLFLEDGPSSIFLRMRNQFLRTSTPKQGPSHQESSPQVKDVKCFEIDNTECLKNENSHSKNTDEKFEPVNKHDLETLLSSSLGSVSLNDIKPLDCKKSLKFEVVSTKNQEEMLLFSKIIHSEPLLASETPLAETLNPPTRPDAVAIEKTDKCFADSNFSGAINRPILSDSVEIEKAEINSFDINPTGAINPPILPDSVEIEKTDKCFANINPSGASNPPNLPDAAEIERTEISSFDINPTGAINPPILLDSVEMDKPDIKSSDSSPANDSKISGPEGDSVFIEDQELPDNNAEKNNFVLNCFPQKQENGPVKNKTGPKGDFVPRRSKRLSKFSTEFNTFENLFEIDRPTLYGSPDYVPMKIQTFRQSEKPGLMSINESLENTPKSAIKNKVLERDFTPRRSSRLAKLSGNFGSLDYLLDFSKQKHLSVHDKTGPKDDFTPRRSKRLSKLSTEFNSSENLFEITRPTLYGSPEYDKPVRKLHSKVMYDFDRLSSETEEDIRPCTTSFGKVSLLPVSRTSIMRHSIKGDLMSFSPDV